MLIIIDYLWCHRIHILFILTKLLKVHSNNLSIWYPSVIKWHDYTRNYSKKMQFCTCSFFFAIIRMDLFHFMIEIQAICYRMNIWKIVSKNKWCQIFSFCLFWCSRFGIVTGESDCTRNHIMRGKSSWTLFCVGPILNKRKLWLVTDEKRNVQKCDWICCIRWVIAVLIRNLKVKLC